MSLRVALCCTRGAAKLKSAESGRPEIAGDGRIRFRLITYRVQIRLDATAHRERPAWVNDFPAATKLLLVVSGIRKSLKCYAESGSWVQSIIGATEIVRERFADK